MSKYMPHLILCYQRIRGKLETHGENIGKILLILYVFMYIIVKISYKKLSYQYGTKTS